MKKKVLQVVGSLRMGGLETVAVNYYKYINKDEFEFHYLTYGNEVGELEQVVENLGGKVIKITSPSKNVLRFLKEVSEVFKDYGPYDIVHSHPLFNSGIIMKLAYHARIPIRITQAHSSKKNQRETFLKKMYMKNMRYNIKKYSTNYIACSNDAGEYLFGSSFFKTHGVVVKNGIDILKFQYDEYKRKKIRKELNINEDFVIGHTGRLSRVKNQELLLDILKLILVEKKNTKLILIGDGPQKKILVEKAKKNEVLDNVLFLGNKTNVQDYLHAMDVFVFPSLYEGLGISLIEAQTSGLPCVVSTEIPDEAILVENVKKVSLHENLETWASVILKYAEKNDREDYTKLIINSGYGIEDTMNEIKRIY